MSLLISERNGCGGCQHRFRVASANTHTGNVPFYTVRRRHHRSSAPVPMITRCVLSARDKFSKPTPTRRRFAVA